MTTRRLSVLAVMIVCLAGVAVAQQDEAPLKNWTAPPYWTPPAPVKEDRPDLQMQVSAQGMTAHTEALPSSPLPFTAIVPCRVADTRTGAGFSGQYGPPSLSPGNRDFTITGQCGIPSGAVAVSFNFSVISMTTTGDLRTVPAGGTTPLVATMTWTGATGVISNAAVVPLGTGGAITVRLDGASTIDLIIDVNGYYGPQSVVTSLTGGGSTLTGDVTLAAGSNIAITPSGNTLTIAMSGVPGGTLPAGASGQTLRSNGSAWLASSALTNDGTNVGISGNLSMPATTSGGAAGVLFLGTTSFLHNYGPAGAHNTFVGESAGNFTMGGSGPQGKYNTASGYQSLYSNTMGYENTASGSQSLLSNTTGFYNTASGAGSLNANTMGTYNTASGSTSLYSNTMGYGNTATGYQSLYSNTTGSNNIASGVDSLVYNTTGSWNTASGFNSLYSNTTGSYNTALGQGAGSNLTTGNYNIDIGNAGAAAEGNTIRIGTAGNQSRAFVAGIRGVTPGVSDGWAVIIDSNGQLGTSAGVGAVSSVFGRTGAVTAASGDYTAAKVTNVPAGTISATDVQGALNGLDASKATLSHTHGATGITGLVSGGVVFGNASGNLGQNAGQLFWDQTNNRLGLGTITPNQQFELTGMMRMPMTAATSGTPTAGVLFLATTPFLHSYGTDNTFLGGGAGNFTTGAYGLTGIGAGALKANTDGNSSTAVGANTLAVNTIGFEDTAVGWACLFHNINGWDNTAVGTVALTANTDGNENTGVGAGSLYRNDHGSDNTAVGHVALSFNTSGSNNIALGHYAGFNLTTGDYNIDVGNQGVAAEANTIRIGTAGNQTRTFIAGIGGVTTGNNDAQAVLIDSAGQLGTISSSIRFKQDVQDMCDASSCLMELRPVTFRYKTQPDGPRHFGLIAEEVEQVMPELVVRDVTGQIETVAYHELPAMLLNELQKQRATIQAQQARVEGLGAQLATERARNDALEMRLAALEDKEAAKR